MRKQWSPSDTERKGHFKGPTHRYRKGAVIIKNTLLTASQRELTLNGLFRCHEENIETSEEVTLVVNLCCVPRQ